MDVAALDAAYDNAAAAGGSAPWIEAWTARGAAFRAERPGRLDVPYGPHERERIDLFPCGRPDAPLMVFFHGGYWHRNRKEVFAGFAAGPTARGIDVAMAGYPLCPEVRMSDLVAATARAVDLVVREGRGWGLGVRGLVLAGWSAGGHLAAMNAGHPACTGLLPVSGVFELEPLRRAGMNAVLRMDEAEAARLSPMHAPPGTCPAVVAWGADELPELRRNSRGLAAALEAQGRSARALPLPGHHFSVLESLERPDGALTEALVSLVS